MANQVTTTPDQLLLAIRQRLIAQGVFSESEAFIVGSRDHIGQYPPSTLYCALLGGGLRFDQSELAGGGRDNCGVEWSVSVFVRKMGGLDASGREHHFYTEESNGLWSKVHEMISALALYDIPGPSGNSRALSRPMRPLDGFIESKLPGHFGNIEIRFGLKFALSLPDPEPVGA